MRLGCINGKEDCKAAGLIRSDQTEYGLDTQGIVSLRLSFRVTHDLSLEGEASKPSRSSETIERALSTTEKFEGKRVTLYQVDVILLLV